MQAQTTTRWLTISTILSVSVCFIAWFLGLNQRTFLDEVELLLFFGIAVNIPLALRLIFQPDRNGQLPIPYHAAIRFHPLATIAVVLAIVLESGFLAAIFAGVWQLQTLLLAFCGLKRLLARPVLAIEELCIDAGLLYIPVSGAWFIAHSLGFPLLGFDRVFALLTAVHFTFISLGALIIAGMMGRQLFKSRVWRVYRAVAWLVVISPALVAAGITTTRFAGVLLLEAVSVLNLAGSFLILMLVYFFGRLPRSTIANMLILLSAMALLITMSLALAYSVGRLTTWWSLSLLIMVQWHGWLNAIGFTFLGLLAWNLLNPEPNINLPGIPFSKLPWRWQIGRQFFQRINAVEVDAPYNPTGIVDRLLEYGRYDFQPRDVTPSVIAFYENTAAHELLVYPEWQPRFRLLARMYKHLSSRLGQMNFPTSPETHETHITSAIIPLRDALDGRERVRGWVRVYTDTGQAVYVAAYASHSYRHSRYMNIAFPFPFGNLTSILHLETPPEKDGGLLLSSYSTRLGDQGVYMVNRFLVIRLPINETIRVFPGNLSYTGYPPAFSKGEILAEHKMWLLGFHFLTLHYSITKLQQG